MLMNVIVHSEIFWIIITLNQSLNNLFTEYLSVFCTKITLSSSTHHVRWLEKIFSSRVTQASSIIVRTLTVLLIMAHKSLFGMSAKRHHTFFCLATCWWLTLRWYWVRDKDLIESLLNTASCSSLKITLSAVSKLSKLCILQKLWNINGDPMGSHW